MGDEDGGHQHGSVQQTNRHEHGGVQQYNRHEHGRCSTAAHQRDPAAERSPVLFADRPTDQNTPTVAPCLCEMSTGMEP